MQTKLLRVLQEREVRRVGENKSRSIDVRIVAASNVDLEVAVRDGTFRQDLYYRLRIISLHLPPLRNRREDILSLACVLMNEAATRMSRSSKRLSTAVADRLVSYSWPGNVRELENAMERAVALSVGPRIELGDLPEEIGTPSTVDALVRLNVAIDCVWWHLRTGEKVRSQFTRTGSCILRSCPGVATSFTRWPLVGQRFFT